MILFITLFGGQHLTGLKGVSYATFLLPGVIGFTIMAVSFSFTVTDCAKNRARGIFRKLATTPISKIEWNASIILTRTITTLLSIIVSLAVAWLLFQVSPQINVFTALLILSGIVLFAGLGTLIAILVRDEDAALPASNAILFALMFVSGTFMPVATLPWYMKDISKLSPLTYLNNGLQDAMLTNNFGDASVNLLVVSVMAVVLFTLGVALLRWKDD
jgi:ABC-2 type transport system permease protein